MRPRAIICLMKKAKPAPNPHASALGKLSILKHPRTSEFYSEIAKKRWQKKEEEKDGSKT